jgi:nucleotide-binding universal stress UspA family protein
VTGEVIDVNKAPVLAVPEQVPFKDLNEVKHVAFATSFQQRDLLAFDRFMEVLKPYKVQIHLFNISTSRDEWNEIRLAGIDEYLKKQYPDASISHTVLADGDLLLAVEKFIRDEQIDIIAISSYRRNVFARIFNPSIARRMLFHTDTPLLVVNA